MNNKVTVNLGEQSCDFERGSYAEAVNCEDCLC